MLYPNIRELEEKYMKIITSETYQLRFRQLLKDYAGRPTPLFEADLTGPLAVLMGGEAKGLRRLTREHCDLLVALPMCGAVESLNVSVATGVILYEAVRQRGCYSQKEL